MTGTTSSGPPAASAPGTLHLLPAPLDVGVTVAPVPLSEVIGQAALRQAASLEHWVVENAKTARQVLARVGAAFPLSKPLQQLSIVELPRPVKGRAAAGSAAAEDLRAWDRLLEPLARGLDLGLMSEAGLPGVADPGARLVGRAHEHGFAVRVHAGASSLVMALAASGLNGQQFAFVGYVPVDAEARAARLRELETSARRHGQTQILIETPYRNAALLDAMLHHLQPGTRLAISVGLTLPEGWSRTLTIAQWRRTVPHLPADVPAVFCIGAP